MKKCSGRYSDNKSAARYVHQMTEEIFSQLAGVSEEVKRAQGEPEIFQALLDEWNENFPPSLGSYGSPKAIAVLLKKQSKELIEVREALADERGSRERDLSEMLNSMDAQLQAYRSSVMSERAQQKLLDKQKTENYESAISSANENHIDEMERLSEGHAYDMQTTVKQYEELMQESNKIIEDLRAEADKNAIVYQNTLQALTAKKDKKIIQLKKKNQTVKGKYKELRDIYDDLGEGGGGDGDDDKEGASGRDDDDTTVDSEPSDLGEHVYRRKVANTKEKPKKSIIAARKLELANLELRQAYDVSDV